MQKSNLFYSSVSLLLMGSLTACSGQAKVDQPMPSGRSETIVTESPTPTAIKSPAVKASPIVKASEPPKDIDIPKSNDVPKVDNTLF
jgi:hypothetical protein